MLFFAAAEDKIEHLVVELGGFLEHGQSESGLHVPPVKEPVVQEVGRVSRPQNPPVECLVVVIPILKLILVSRVYNFICEPHRLIKKHQQRKNDTESVHVNVSLVAPEFRDQVVDNVSVDN